MPRPGIATAKPSDSSPDPLTDVLRAGAREILATAVRAEASELVTGMLGVFQYCKGLSLSTRGKLRYSSKSNCGSHENRETMSSCVFHSANSDHLSLTLTRESFTLLSVRMYIGLS